MRGISTLILSIVLLSVALGSTSVHAQGVSRDFFPTYQETKAHAPGGSYTDSNYWDQQYAHQADLQSSIEKDIGSIFREYLDGTLPDQASINTSLQSDLFLKNNFETSSSKSLLNETLNTIRSHLPQSRLAQAIDAAHTNQLIPIHFRVFDDENEAELSAYYERGTHRVKMALNRVVKENWLTWFAHEHYHFFDPILRKAEVSSGNSARLDQIAAWVQAGRHDLAPMEQTLLESYFADLTDTSIKAEWRAWIATSLFAQTMLHAGLIQSVPPCLSFLTEFGFGSRDLSLPELKKIWWEKLKAGFFVQDTGLFTDAWLKQKLLDYVAQIKEEQLEIPALLDLTN